MKETITATLVCLLCGCTVSRGPDGRRRVELRVLETVFDNLTDRGDREKRRKKRRGEDVFDPEELWRQGYGFNNPNAVRGRSEPHVPFSGAK